MGLTAAGLRTDAGRQTLVTAMLKAANDAINGSITVSSVTGSFLAGLTAIGVTVREANGALLASVPRLQLGYGLRDILGGRIVLGHLELVSPKVTIAQRPGRLLNLEEVFGFSGDSRKGPSPLIAFSEVAITDGVLEFRAPAEPADSMRAGVEATPDGPMKVRRITDLDARLPYLRISSPLPLESGIRVDVAALRATVSDPSLSIENARGRITVVGDSIGLELAEVRLPSSRAEVRGILSMTDVGLMMDLSIEAQPIATDEVRGLVSDLPAGLVGNGMVTVRSLAPDAVSFELDGFAIDGVGGGGSARGRLAMQLGPGENWSFADTRLDLRDFDLEYIRSFFDTLPIAGRATGRFESDGNKEALRLGLDVTFRDSLVEGWPVNRLEADGTVAVGGPGEVVFHDFRLTAADLDLNSVRQVLPAVDLQGRLSGSGTLNGPWLQAAFSGSLRHEDAPLSPSRAHGTLRLDARGDTLGVWSDLQFDSLSVDGLHSSYPELRDVTGSLAGRVVLSGYLDSAVVEANLAGPAGAIFADGVTRLLPPGKGFSQLDLRVARLNLQKLNPRLPETELFGRLRGAGMLDSVSGSWAHADAVVRASLLEGVRVDSVTVSLAADRNTVRLDTLEVWGRRLRMTGRGEIGVSQGFPGAITLTAANDSMAAIEPLLQDLFGTLEPEFAEVGQPWGSMSLAMDVSGTLQEYEASAELDVRNLDRGRLHVSRLHARGSLSPAERQLEFRASADSIEFERWEFADLGVQIGGPVDSLGWFARTRFGSDGLGAWIGRGRLIDEGRRRRVSVDLMGFLLASGAWFVDPSAVIQLGDSGLDLTRVVASRDGGAGKIVLNGRVPLVGTSDLVASVEALPLEDLWILLQGDYRDVSGDVGATFTMSGTRDAPVMELSVGMVRGRFGRFQVPQMLASLSYQNKHVAGDVRLLRTGQEILNVSVRLPLDLALRHVERRTLPDTLSVRAIADGVDLSFLDAVTPLVRQATGLLDADFGLTGTWDAPVLTGGLSIADGAATYPGLGVRHEGLNGSFRLSGDTIAIQRLSMRSGRGSADVGGYIQLEELSRPVLHLDITADRFDGIDLRDFLTLTASGELQLRGPLFDATATGDGTVTAGVLYFADLISKDIINIEDTLYSQFADPSLIRQEGLGVAFQNRFLNSLRVDSLRLHMGPDVWMRSSEANIQLLGDLTVNKVGRQYSLNGTLQTPRGVYRVTPGPSLVQLVATRDFTVTRGEVTYLGTPDLDAAVDIEARHRVRGVRGEDLTVTVHIGGTVYEPRLTFSSDVHPPISETEILSYLFFGAPSLEALVGTGNFADQRLVEQGLNQFLSAVTGQLEYSLISDFNVPLDYLQIRPTGVGTGVYGVDLAVGKRLGEKWFVTVNPRYCKRSSALSIEDVRVGASLEYRLSREWMLLLSGDPVKSCSAFLTPQFADKYQLGVDLFWDKRY